MDSFGANSFEMCTCLSEISLPKAASIGNTAFSVCSGLATVILGEAPPTIGTRIFHQAATEGQTITFKVHAAKLDEYKAATIATGKTWADVTNKSNTDALDFWDNTAATKANLTVTLASL